MDEFPDFDPDFLDDDDLEDLTAPNDDHLHARTGDPDTSHAAMAAYDREKLKSAIECVVSLHETQGPLADFELAPLFDRTFSPPHCDHLYRQARSKARDLGQIRDTGHTKINPATKREQILWEACRIGEVEIPRCPTCGRLNRPPRKRKKKETDNGR